ncbi:DinB family protein [Alkalihalobacillus pseudalcaliphilus]|uniref:DinB family protein n=1 Tax=Alkalihalobacillus pseudalcaliphilus TaxID=79884 RepID=UPI00064DEECB|nr:DinB family protein [Alkalihalobacillus pseudalcaliphilus]KMK77708.1 hypothetical protein AB990_04430 [Alkalihalobacillus pseudalcaliphilus]
MKPRHEILLNQLNDYRGYLLYLVNDITEEQAALIPNGFRNNIHWNLGHIYLDQFLWIHTLTKEQKPEIQSLNKWFGFGTTPENFTEETPSFNEITELLQSQIATIHKTYGEHLETEYPPVEMGMFTIEQVLSRTIFHEGMHIQAILDIKKFIND